MKTARSFAVAAALGAALSAHAAFIDLASSGYNLYGATQGDFETVTSQTGGLGALTDLTYVSYGGAFTGSYTGPSGRLDVSFTTVGSSTGRVYGSWQAAGGTGAYEGAFGGGVWQTAYVPVGLGTHVANTTTTFSGAIRAVPEPATVCTTGLGAAALLRRRKTTRRADTH